MSANRPDNDTPNTTGGPTGSTGAGNTSTGGGAGAYGGTSSTGIGAGDTGVGSLTRGSSTTTPTGGGTGAATGLAQQYGQKIADAASTAKEYVTERAGVVGEKIQDLRNKDYQQIATDAKEYAKQNPGQALLISAAAGFLLGILLRGSRR